MGIALGLFNSAYSIPSQDIEMTRYSAAKRKEQALHGKNIDVGALFEYDSYPRTPEEGDRCAFSDDISQRPYGHAV